VDRRLDLQVRFGCVACKSRYTEKDTNMCPVEKKEFEHMIELAEKIGFTEEDIADLVATYGCREKAKR
jgi:RNA polymerase subunit RPABC4/transcription elongation factor Spt4